MVNIKTMSFQVKLVSIFLIPSFAFLYFSFLYVQNEYKTQNQISRYKYSIELMSTISNLVHSLQIERGLSAGYIISNRKNIKINLLEQYEITDKDYSKLFKISKENFFISNINIKNQDVIFKAINLLKNKSDIRKSVLASNIDFNTEIDYYSAINNKLILFIKNTNSDFTNIHHDNNTIDYFLQIQEYAGLERAFTYNFLLSPKKENEILWSIQEYFKQKKRLKENLLQSATSDSILLYKNQYNREIEEKVYYCSSEILKDNFYKLNAEKCFNASTKYINMLDNIYKSILNRYTEKSNELYNNSLKHLYIILVLEVIFILNIIFLLYILFKLINNEEKNKVDLRIAAYTFEAKEGVVITDGEGIILKVNKSFTTITGYTEDEARGNTPRILKSDQHPESFYNKIWDRLILEGQWQGEIINKRKNGDFYNEMLSISSIKNEDEVTTHYIAQFLEISEIREAQKDLQYQVDHDSLTGLLNRKALNQRLTEEYAKAKRHNLQCAFLFIDLDHFKNINDTYGHDIGDKLLVVVAKRLKSILREEDVVSRISGDEFGVLLTSFEIDKVVIEHITTKILSEIAKEMNFGKHSIYISISIGIKLFPEENTSLEDIIIHADDAMYKAKEQGKNQFVFYKKRVLYVK